MKVHRIAGMASALLRNPHIFLKKKIYILVISHMRSYSSLLCHILGSHIKISGYSEMGQPYTWWGDFMKLRYKVYAANDHKLEGLYVLDKILHNNIIITEKILNRKDVVTLFMIRSPASTFRSIINMNVNIRKVTNNPNVKGILNYYVQRLSKIKNYAMNLRGKALFLESEKIMDNSENLLRDLSRWLDLDPQLTSSYDTFQLTGKPSHGDPSDRIKQGKIIKNVPSYKNIHIPGKIIEQAEEAYVDCKKTLQNLLDTP